MISRNVSAGSALLVLFATVVAGQIAPQDYTQWRGQNRDGSASAFTDPKSWPDKLNRKWKVEVGEGYATPLVVGKTVFTFTRREGEETMTALDAETGRELWRTGYPAAYTASAPASAHGNSPKATPAFYDGKLFTLGVSGIVCAFDASTGKILWRTSPPSEAPFFGAAASPVAESGIVITHPGNYEPLTAFDASTGAVKWKAGGGGFFMAPIIVRLGGQRQVVSVTLDSVIGVAVPDGRLLWSYPWAGGGGGPMPVLYDGMFIVSGLDAGVTAFRPTERNGMWTTDRVWETKDVSMYISNPVVMGDTLFGLSRRDGGQFFALDAKNGNTLWLGEPRQAKNSAVAKSGNLLFFLNDDANLIVARSSRTRFEPLQQYKVADTETWAQPAISGRRIFVKDVSSITLWTLD